MTQYTEKTDELVFLNDKNIAQERNDITSIAYNAVPSLSLFNSTYDELTARDFDLETSANGISATVTALSDSLSNFIGQSYNALSAQTSATSTLLSAAVKHLSGAVDFLSDEISGTATVFKNTTFLSNRVKIIEVTNDQYNTIIAQEKQEDAALYVIEDNYYSARGCQLKDLAHPSDLSDATNKTYVDQQDNRTSSAAVISSNAYADIISSELCTTSDLRVASAKSELSSTLSSYTNKEVLSLSTSLSNTVKNAGYALYDDFDFSYDSNNHKILLTLTDQRGLSNQLSVDSTDFIRNRILYSAEVTRDEKSGGALVLRLYWKKPEEEVKDGTYTDIKISDLTKVYKAGFGINITDTLTISVTDDIATKSQLDGVADTVEQLSTTTYSTLTGNIDSVSAHAGRIQDYIDKLSVNNPNGILHSINDRIDEISTSLTGNNDGSINKRLQAVEGLQSDVVDVRATVNTLSTGIIADLEREYNGLKTTQNTLTAAIETINTTDIRQNYTIKALSTGIINAATQKLADIENKNTLREVLDALSSFREAIGNIFI